MRAHVALTACAMTAVAAVAVAGCGGGGSKGSATISPAAEPSTTAAPNSPTPSATQAGAPLKLDPAVALPADVKVVFDWAMPSDVTRNAALTAVANYLQAVDHAVVKQNVQDPPLHAYAAGDALAHGKDFVRSNVTGKVTLSGTDRYFDPAFGKGGGRSSLGITLCEDQSKLYSKDIATGKVHVTGDDPRNYVSYSVVVVKIPAAHPYWQVQGLTAKEGAPQCRQ
ncbi:MAG: hypothetical protein HOY69_21130 [Streptomyces sp.]|nr:hypothetical protein [Streptomyces sp.]